MNVNLSASFSSIMAFLVDVFKSVISWLDGIIIIGDSTSLLDLNIALSVFGIIFTAVFAVVSYTPNYAGDTVKEARAANKAKQEKIERDLKKQREKRLKEGAAYGKT